jgi:hypothetical protein
MLLGFKMLNLNAIQKNIIDYNLDKIKILLKDQPHSVPLELLFIYCCENNHHEIITLLLSTKLSKFKLSNEMFFFIVLYQHYNIVKIILNDRKKYSHINHSKQIITAIDLNNTKLSKLLINNKWSDNSWEDNSPIKEALYNNNEELVELLFNDEKVRSLLKKNDIKTYEKLFNKFVLLKLRGF